MKAARRTAVAQVEESLVSLFVDRPELCGFTVALDGALVASNVGLWPAPRPEEAKRICDEIRAALDDMVDGAPEARALLAGRTFARRLH